MGNVSVYANMRPAMTMNFSRTPSRAYEGGNGMLVIYAFSKNLLTDLPGNYHEFCGKVLLPCSAFSGIDRCKWLKCRNLPPFSSVYCRWTSQ